MSTLTNGLSQGDFTLLNVLHNGTMTDILTLVGVGGGGGGAVTSATSPLSISSGVLSLSHSMGSVRQPPALLPSRMGR